MKLANKNVVVYGLGKSGRELVDFLCDKKANVFVYDDKIEKLAGKRCKVFRAPFGEYNDTVITTMRSLGYEVIQWDIDTMDTICKGGFWVNYL